MGYTVLIVEDEPIVALELKETLIQHGYKVPEVATTADGVLEAFNRVKPALVLMDINLRSYTDGVDAAHRLGLFDDAPVVFLTGNRDPHVEKRARATSNSYYVQKPFDEDRLIELLDQILSGSGE